MLKEKYSLEVFVDILYTEYKIARYYYEEIPTDYNKGGMETLEKLIKFFDPNFFGEEEV